MAFPRMEWADTREEAAHKAAAQTPVSAGSAHSDGMPARTCFLEKGTNGRPASSQIRQRDTALLP